MATHFFVDIPHIALPKHNFVPIILLNHQRIFLVILVLLVLVHWGNDVFVKVREGEREREGGGEKEKEKEGEK